MKRILLALAVATFTGQAAETISGAAYVIDGDTIRISGAHIRLSGIDAPEREQSCMRGAAQWRCGEAAKESLVRFIAGRALQCSPRDRDRYGRIVAVCFVNGEDVGGWMVREGWALAYRRYSRDYVDAEKAARTHRRGIWTSRFEAPWRWRRAHRW